MIGLFNIYRFNQANFTLTLLLLFSLCVYVAGEHLQHIVAREGLCECVWSIHDGFRSQEEDWGRGGAAAERQCRRQTRQTDERLHLKER